MLSVSGIDRQYLLINSIHYFLLVSPLVVTYFVIDQESRSSMDLMLDGIDRGQMARSVSSLAA